MPFQLFVKIILPTLLSLADEMTMLGE